MSNETRSCKPNSCRCILTRYSLTRDQRISGKARAQMLDMYTIRHLFTGSCTNDDMGPKTVPARPICFIVLAPSCHFPCVSVFGWSVLSETMVRGGWRDMYIMRRCCSNVHFECILIFAWHIIRNRSMKPRRQTWKGDSLQRWFIQIAAVNTMSLCVRQCTSVCIVVCNQISFQYTSQSCLGF